MAARTKRCICWCNDRDFPILSFTMRCTPVWELVWNRDQTCIARQVAALSNSTTATPNQTFLSLFAMKMIGNDAAESWWIFHKRLAAITSHTLAYCGPNGPSFGAVPISRGHCRNITVVSDHQQRIECGGRQYKMVEWQRVHAKCRRLQVTKGGFKWEAKAASVIEMRGDICILCVFAVSVAVYSQFQTRFARSSCDGAKNRKDALFRRLWILCTNTDWRKCSKPIGRMYCWVVVVDGVILL